MRKIIAFSFVLSLFCSVYAERITGFMGIKFGTKIEDVELKLKEMDFHYYNSQGMLSPGVYKKSYTSDSFTFLSLKPVLVEFLFSSDTDKMIGYDLLFFDPGEHFLRTLKDCYGDLEYQGLSGNGMTVTYYDPYNNRVLNILLVPVNDNCNVTLLYRENDFNLN